MIGINHQPQPAAGRKDETILIIKNTSEASINTLEKKQ